MREANPNETVSTHWVDGRVVDAQGDRPFAWSWVLSLIGLIFTLDLVLGASLPDTADELGGSTLRSLEAPILRIASSDAQRRFLLVGDSVLAGDVMASEHDNWAHERVIDHMRAEVHPDANVALEQVALNGLLPVDAAAIVRRLDREDPSGEVDLVLEFNPRYFSRSYRAQSECTRAEICDLAWADADGLGVRLRSAGRRANAAALRVAPLWRHRTGVGPATLDDQPGLLVAVDEEEEGNELGASMARVVEHYRTSAVAREHRQVQALRELIAATHQSTGRQVHVFVTPLDDGFAARAFGPQGPGHLYARLAGLVHDASEDEANLVILDHPRFVDAHFLDHCHLRSEGNRMLAVGLLAELGVRLRRAPDPHVVNHGVDRDRTLVANVERGSAEGPAWAARFENASGIAFSPDGRTLAISDRGNHVIRRLRGSMQIVETWIGESGKAGGRDGAPPQARLHGPGAMVWTHDGLLVVDGPVDGRLRLISDGEVSTVRGPPRTRGYKNVRALDGTLWLLDGAGSVWVRPSPEAVWVEALPRPRSGRWTAFEFGGDALFAADSGGQIHRWDVTGVDLSGHEISFHNRGRALVPPDKNAIYPFAFRDVRVDAITGMHWLDAYDAMLVEVVAVPKHKKPKAIGPTENVHLRVFDFQQRRVHPWIKSRAFTDSSLMWNAKVKSFVSSWHRGAFALSPDQDRLAHVDQDRSRVTVTGDGLQEVAKTATHNGAMFGIGTNSRLANRASVEVIKRFRPERFVGELAAGRDGPYIGLVVGSSMSTLSDRVGNYSLARRLDQELARDLGWRHGQTLEVYQRQFGAAKLPTLIQLVENFIAVVPNPDFVIVMVQDVNNKLTLDVDDVPATLARLAELARGSDAMVVLVDNASQAGRSKDGLRAISRATAEVLDIGERLGFAVIRPTPFLFPQLLDLAPWVLPPYTPGNHHGSPWAIDATAKAISALLAPRLAEFLHGREPAWTRPAVEGTELGVIAGALQPIDWEDLSVVLPDARADRVDVAIDDGTLTIFVDVAGLEGSVRDTDLDALALRLLYEALVLDVYGPVAVDARVTMAAFTNYDEYGAGVRDSARRLYDREFNADSLSEFLDAGGWIPSVD